MPVGMRLQGCFIFYLQDSRLNYLQTSVIYAVDLVLSALLCLPMGNIAGRYGRKTSITFGQQEI